MSDTLICQRIGNIVHLRFNRPEVLNAINAEMAQAFLVACKDIAADPEVRAVVLSGEGRAFVAGGDLGQFRKDPCSIPATLIDPMHEALLLLANLRAPVIASMHGAVTGAGMSIALACDLAIAADNTRFNLAYANVGTSCDLSASWSLPRVVGMRRALQIALLSETIDADEALRIGLVNFVVAVESLADEADKLARKLASSAPVALGTLKRLIRESSDRSLEEQMHAERDGFVTCIATKDFSEAVSAFFEKRSAQYIGQ